MKNINQLANSLGVTRQTIYNIVKNVPGLSIDDLTTKKQGNIRLFDEEAEKRIAKILRERRNCKATADSSDKRKLAEAEERTRQLQKELEDLRKELTALKEDNSILIKTNATQAVTIQTFKQEQQELTAGEAGREPGWIRRAWRALLGKDDTE